MSILNWIEDKKRLKVLNVPKHVATSADSSKGLWTRCDKCGIILYIKHLKENQRVCFGCSYHLQMMSGERIENLLDKIPATSSPTRKKSSSAGSNEGDGGTGGSVSGRSTWRPLDETVSPCDPLRFHDQKRYRDRLRDAQERTGLQDAIQTGTGMIDGIPVALAVMDFSFMGGSMGSVVGEKITRLIEYATGEGLTLLIVSASGGARMQEGVFSLMQMAKISSALRVYQSCARLLYISILTSPTTGGVTASFAMLGDIIFAEPKALIAFAGRRVIEQTLSEDLPDDFQTSEYMLHHGLVDLIVPRRFLRQAVSESIRLYQNAPFKKRGQIPFGVQNPISFLTEEKIRRSWGVLTVDRNTEGDRPYSTLPAGTAKRSDPYGSSVCKGNALATKEDLRGPTRMVPLLPKQGSNSNTFGRYREILTSFEGMLDLFLSGNLCKAKATPSVNSIQKENGFHTEPGKAQIVNHLSDGQGGKELLSFWLYNGMILRKQDGGKKRVEQAQLHKHSFARLRIQVLSKALLPQPVSYKSTKDLAPDIPKHSFSFASLKGKKSKTVKQTGCFPICKKVLPLMKILQDKRFASTFVKDTHGVQKDVTTFYEKGSNGSTISNHKIDIGSSIKKAAPTQKGAYQKLGEDLYLNFLIDGSENRLGNGTTPPNASYLSPVKTEILYNDLTRATRNKHIKKNQTGKFSKKRIPLSLHLYQKRRRALKNKKVLQASCNLSYRTLLYLSAKNADSIFSVFKKENRSLLYKKLFTFKKLSNGVKQIENSFLVRQNPLQISPFGKNLGGHLKGKTGNVFRTLSSNSLSGSGLAKPSFAPATKDKICNHEIQKSGQSSSRTDRSLLGRQSKQFASTFVTVEPTNDVSSSKPSSVLRKAKSQPCNSFIAMSARNEIDRSSLLHDFRVFSENIDSENKKLGVSTTFNLQSKLNDASVRLRATSAQGSHLQVKGNGWNNRSSIGLKHTDYLCERALFFLQDKDRFSNLAFNRSDTLTGSGLRNRENGFAKKRLVTLKTLSIVTRKSELYKQDGGFTTRKADINFLNQAIELAATEGVEWRAFYIYQQLSENTGFLEDFLQQDPDSRKKNGNVLFYKSICRSEKALGGTKNS